MQWDDLLRAWLVALKPYFDEDWGPDCVIKDPATQIAIDRAAKKMRRTIPEPIRDFLLYESAHIFYSWNLDGPAARRLPKAFPRCGYVEFNLPTMINLNTDRYIPDYGKDPASYVDRWKQAFAFSPVANGDALALDLHADPVNPPVIYLDHEVPDNHIRLGESFDEFIDAWFELACIGPEIWDIRHFLTDNSKPLRTRSNGSPTSRIDPDCEFALRFLQRFGMA